MGLFSKKTKENEGFDATKPMFNEKHEKLAWLIVLRFSESNVKSKDEFFKVTTTVLKESGDMSFAPYRENEENIRKVIKIALALRAYYFGGVLE